MAYFVVWWILNRLSHPHTQIIYIDRIGGILEWSDVWQLNSTPVTGLPPEPAHKVVYCVFTRSTWARVTWPCVYLQWNVRYTPSSFLVEIVAMMPYISNTWLFRARRLFNGPKRAKICDELDRYNCIRHTAISGRNGIEVKLQLHQSPYTL